MISFRDVIRQKDFVVTADVPLRPDSTAAEVRDSVDIFAKGVDAVQIADDRSARGNMAGIAAASLALQQGVDAVLHISCRDRNRIALQADILGAAALGVTSMVLLRGNKLNRTDTQHAKGVFEIDATRLMEIARIVSEENELVSPPGFFLGSQMTVFQPDENWHAERVVAKLDSGAQFLQSQPCLNIEPIEKYVTRLIDQKIMHRSSIVIDVPLLGSAKDAHVLKKSQPAAMIGEAAINRLSTSNDSLAEGIALCAEVVTALQKMRGVSGVNIRHDGDPKNVMAALKIAGIGA